MMNIKENKDLLAELRRNGFVVLENWISGERLSALREEVVAMETMPPDWVRAPDKDLGNIVHFSPITARRWGQESQVTNIGRAFNDPFFRSLCDAYLGRGWGFDRIILERDLPRQEALSPWHVDHFPFAERCLKFFIYLEDTDTENGSFSYVPGWHNLVRSLSGELANFRVRQDSLHWYEQVVDAARYRAIRLAAGGDAAGAAEIETILDDVSAHIQSNNSSDAAYSIVAPAGSVIIFDPAGLHRGGVVRRGERLIVRSHCLESKMARVLSSRNDMVVFANRKYARIVDGLQGRSAFV